MIRNKLVAFLSSEVAAITLVTEREAKEGFLSFSNEEVTVILSAINRGDELLVGQMFIAAARAAHTKRAQDKVVTVLADESLSFRTILKRLRAISN